jgi:hypothetical protein
MKRSYTAAKRTKRKTCNREEVVEAMTLGNLYPMHGIKAEWSKIDAGDTSVLHVRLFRDAELVGHWYPSKGTLYRGKKIGDKVPGTYRSYDDVVQCFATSY